MKIAILGAGAMGSLYGGSLSEKNDVYLIDVWKEHVDIINSEGLKIKIKNEDKIYHPKAVMSTNDVGSVDLVMIFVKSVNTAEALSKSNALFGETTMALTLQNGYGNDEDILPYVKKENLLIGATASGATVLGPGYVFQAGVGPTNIGVRKDGCLDKAQIIVDLFNESGIETYKSDNVLQAIWTKLMVNVGINAISALLDTRNGFLAESKAAYDIAYKLVKEGVEVAKAEGYVLNAEEICEKYYIQGAKVVGHNRCSMLQDVDKKRKTEVEKINGAISSIGKKHGIVTPYNDLMVEMINAKEDSYNFQ
jgi:2-dehydropantoate 2-reductase